MFVSSAECLPGEPWNAERRSDDFQLADGDVVLAHWRTGARREEEIVRTVESRLRPESGKNGNKQIGNPDSPSAARDHGTEFSATALHSHGDGPGFKPIAIQGPPEIGGVYEFPLETADLRDVHPGECRHQGDFLFRRTRNLQDVF